MAAISSSLGVCTLCHRWIAEKYLKAGGVYVQQSKREFLLAQNECYFCTWLGHSIGPKGLRTLPENLDRYFSISYDEKLWHESSGEYRRNVLTVGAAYQNLKFYETKSTDVTHYMPSAISDCLDSQLSVFAENWMRNCRLNHARCRPLNQDFRPKRLVHIVDEDHWKLVFPRDLPSDEVIEYVALSHCWGGDTELLKLTTDNEHRLRGSVGVENLPQTFMEAISACVRLQFRHLWIDSLCIIQDNPADWHEQAAEMDLVYGNSALNLCMAASANPSEASLLSRDTRLTLPVAVSLTGHDGKEAIVHFVCNGMYEVDIKQSPLRTRGWVLQEWYLSKRSLIFGRMQLWWHCCEELACETFPKEIPVTTLALEVIEETRTMKNRDLWVSPDLSKSFKLWQDLISQYAATKLTMELKDRLIAFSGISRAFGNTHDIERQYMAGLWRYHLPHALLWHQHKSIAASRSLEGYKAPSWSWMSLDGPIAFKPDFSPIMVKRRGPTLTVSAQCYSIEQVHLPLMDEHNVMGRLRGGYLQVQGHILGLDVFTTFRGLKGSRVFDFAVQKEISRFHSGSGYALPVELNWDEVDSNGCKVVSYIDNIAMDGDQGELPTGFTRTRVTWENASNSYFALPLLRQAGEPEAPKIYVSGLVLYQPPDQSDIFHRVAVYHTWIEQTFAAFTDKLETHSPARSIRIY